MCLTFAFSRYHPYHGWGCVIGIIIFDLIIIATVIMSIRFSGNRLDTKNDYAPGDTRIVSHSSIFCQSLTLRDTSSTAATLYLLREKPQLTGHDSFTVTRSNGIAPEYENHLYYYLYPGSNFSVSTCLWSGTLASFYLIKGTHNFNKWSDNPSSYYALHHFDITSPCSQGKKNYTSSFSIEDQYYFVLYNPSDLTVGFDATYTFDCVLYQPMNSTIVDSCKAGGLGSLSSSCTLGHERPLKTKGDHWRPGETSRDRWRPGETTGDQGRPAETPGDQRRPLETMRDPWRPRETPGDQGSQRPHESDS